MNRIFTLLIVVVLFPSDIQAANSDCDLLSPEFIQTATPDDIQICFNVAGSAGINARSDDGNTPLHIAVVNSPDSNVIRKLLELGADPTAPNADGWTPAHSLAALGRVPSHVAALKVFGADIDAPSPDDECSIPLRTCATTPLHRVAKRADVVDLLRAFLAAGAEVDALAPTGRTALHHAAAQSGWEEVETLLAAGSSVDAEDFNDWTPLHLAAQRGPGDNLPAASNYTIVRMLLSAGADPNAMNERDLLPVMLAASYTDNLAIWEALLEATDIENWCEQDDRGREIKDMFDLNKNLNRDDHYWKLNKACP